MRCLIVTAHPSRDSLAHHLSDVAAAALVRHELTLQDLGTTDFAPALTALEWQSHFTPPFESPSLGPQIDALRQAQVLILIAPIWWAGLPALMKGWFDRVWAPGHAFDPHTAPGQIRPLLTGLRHVVLITTHGAPWYVDWLVQRRPVQRMLRQSLLRLCAPQARLTSLSLYRAEGVTPDRLARFCARLTGVIARL